jgi:hypothetical protein
MTQKRGSPPRVGSAKNLMRGASIADSAKTRSMRPFHRVGNHVEIMEISIMPLVEHGYELP